MEKLDIQRMIHDYLKDNLRVSISTETELDYYNEYAVIKMCIRLRNPDGQWEELDSDSDSIPNVSNSND